MPRPLRIKPNKIDRTKYYIVDSYDLHKPRLLWNEFTHREDADEAIVHYLDNRNYRYSVCKGSKAIFHELRFYWDLLLTRSKDKFKRIDWIEITKYRIPPHITTLFGRNHYRRLVRRKLKNLNK